MLCPQCRSWNFRDYRFCRECGGKLDPAAVPADESVDPRVEELLHHAFTALDQGELDLALNKVQEALALQPGSAPAHSALSSIYERRGMIPEAIQQVEIALQLNPDGLADQEKLSRLQVQLLPPPRTVMNSRTQIAGAAAIIAATLVFGIGAAVMLRPQDTQRGGTTPPTGTPAVSTSSLVRPRNGSTPAPAAAWGVTPPGGAAASSTPATATNALTATPVTQLPTQSANSASPGTAWGGSQGSAPLASNASGVGQPPPPPPAAEPLAPAVVGRVLPLEPAATQETGAPGAAPVAAATPGIPATTEPSEPATGFIQIDAGPGATNRAANAPEGARAEATPAAPAAPAPPPRIEMRFSRGNASGAAPQGSMAGDSPLGSARRTERQAFAAMRRGDSSEAARLFRTAEQQYQGVAARGGSGARQAEEGLEACRRVLDRLR
jgi:hypothetical protein